MNVTFNREQYMKEPGMPFWIQRTKHDQHNNPPLHSHDFVELVYVVGGEAEHIFEEQAYPLVAGDVFIINPGERHTYRMKQGNYVDIVNCLFMSSLIEATWLRHLGHSSMDSMDYFYVQPFLSGTERFHHRLNLHGKNAQRVFTILQTMQEEMKQERNGFSIVVRLALVELLILLSRYYDEWRTGETNVEQKQVTTNQTMLVQRICGYLERHYAQQIPVGSIGDLFAISTRQLNRLFKKETGMTVLERLQHVRIEKAKLLLLHGDDKIITIAGKVGYDDPAFFSRLFRRYVGCSPGKYRSMHSE